MPMKKAEAPISTVVDDNIGFLATTFMVDQISAKPLTPRCGGLVSVPREP